MVPQEIYKGKVTGRLWPSREANIVLQAVRKDIIDKLRKRDEAYGIVDGKVGEFKQVGSDKVYVINPTLQKLVHTPAETKAALDNFWNEFCSQPRDVVEELAKVGAVPITWSPPGATADDMNNVMNNAIEKLGQVIADAVAGNHPQTADASNAVSVQPPGELNPVSVPDMIADGKKKRSTKTKK